MSGRTAGPWWGKGLGAKTPGLCFQCGEEVGAGVGARGLGSGSPTWCPLQVVRSCGGAVLADYHRCMKVLTARGRDTKPCLWYYRVFTSLCPLSWVGRG